ncbi:Ada metal-binding domain-containing protein [Ruminococcus flavefaciens]|uniref:Ada metal-binding domain-containing protein n=1 Tax=Ruminococcus flavefaciens TaxID=1265 RepID=UPI00046635AD|nr:Ada metal-binding domain-containing protein [Ruminococcus flavefaciens]
MKHYKLIGVDGKEYSADSPGTIGGHRKLKIYGRLDCPSALRHITKGEYVKYRVFFADEETAIAAGYRPCGICMKEEYRKWKKKQNSLKE